MDLEMDLEAFGDPDKFLKKEVLVQYPDGRRLKGSFEFYNYDYDDDGNEFIEFDICVDGLLVGVDTNEIVSIKRVPLI